MAPAPRAGGLPGAVVRRWLLFGRPRCEHAFGPWRIELRTLVGPFGRTQDEVLRRRCEKPGCGHVQQKEIEKLGKK